MRLLWVSSAILFAGAAPVAAQGSATPPVPLGSVTDWIHPDDYPPAAIRMGEEGRVSVRLAVDANGLVTGCTVTNSSGHPLLDARTCAVLTQRARFQPARDASGRAVAAISIDWKIPRSNAPAPSPTAADAKAKSTAMAAAASLAKAMGTPVPETRVVTPERLKLIAPLFALVDFDAAQKSLSEIGLAMLEARFAPSFAAFPAMAKSKAEDDLHAAYDAADQRLWRTNRDRMMRYFAARLNDDDIRSVIAFYTSGIGQQALHASLLTPADRQAVGKAMVDHPAVGRYRSVALSYFQSVVQDAAGPGRTAAGTAFEQDLMTELCPRLRMDHIALPACPVPPTGGQARPPRLPTSHL